jgi:hypothetical protein
MKKNILLVFMISVAAITLVVLSFVFYKIQPENVYLPISTAFFLFCFMIQLLYNLNEKKQKRFLSLGKTIIFKEDILFLIIFLILLVVIGIFSAIDNSWMHISFAWFLGIDFVLIRLLFYKPYLFSLRRKKIIFGGIMSSERTLPYADIQNINIEPCKITFIKKDGNQISCDVKLTEIERNRMTRILTKKGFML